ncbi:MAG: MFS transporter [Deltaproteobacteria bacterium]|nr:MFS transporter [Deltaproteobacteria bacterium]
MGEVSSPFSDDEKAQAIPNATGGSSTSVEKIGTFSSLRIHNFRWLLTGTTLSNAAQWIQQVTLSWLVYDLTGSGTMLGSINVVRSVASLGMIPIAGVLIDRFNRRKLMFLENGWLFTITLGIGLILIFSSAHISYLFIFSFLGGLIQTISGNLRQVVVFDLVPRSHAPNAVALVQTGWSLMRSFGPGIGGFLILWFGPGGNFIFQAGAYALITVTIIQIQFPSRKLGAVGSSPLQNIKEGIRYVLKAHITRTFTMMGFILPLFIIPIFNILTPIYAKDVFHGGSDILGLLMSSVGVGGIAGGVVTASLGRIERRGLVQLASLFLLSIILIGFAFTTKLWTAFSLLALAGFFEMIFLTTNQTLLQLSIPDHLRGRVTSVVNLYAALSPLGALMAGGGSDLLGGPKMITIVLCSIAAVIAVCVFLGSTTVRNYRLSQAIATDSADTSADSGT